MLTTKCPVNNLYRELLSKQKTFSNPQDIFYLDEIKRILLNITRGIGNKSTTKNLLSKISDFVKYAKEAKNILLKAYDVIEKNIEIFENHILYKVCLFDECPLLVISPCQRACPADIDIPTFITLIGKGRYEEAIKIIRKDNPFPWICGLICTRPCEINCVRARIDSPLSIMYLKAFVANKVFKNNLFFKRPENRVLNGKKVAIIGSGPAGLSCAYYLAVMGYAVCVIENFSKPGGMLRVGIPEFRLPREILDAEIEFIKSLGVRFRLNTTFGKDVDINSLKEEGFEAFFIGIGAHVSASLGIEGENIYSPVISAVDFLRDINLGTKIFPGERVVIIGGGNVAIDAARTCVRLGCREVIVAYRRSKEEMPAHEHEIKEAMEEGVIFKFLTIPKRILGTDGKVEAVECLKAELGDLDASGRRKPIPIQGSEFKIYADAIISAIGQKIEKNYLKDIYGESWTREGVIEPLKWENGAIYLIDSINMRTNIKGVFAAGDAVLGPATVAQAIGGGKRAAYGIDAYLSQKKFKQTPLFPRRRGRESFLFISMEEKLSTKRMKENLPSSEDRKKELCPTWKEETALSECIRCLRCDVCIRCKRCVEVCENEVKIGALSLGYLEERETNIEIIQELCIGCGACARNCPTGAMQIKDIENKRILSLCGAELCRLELVFCERCGEIIGTKKQLEKIRKEVSFFDRKDSFLLCDKCLKETAAKGFYR
jgi:putative selenate reductase YgfK subunit